MGTPIESLDFIILKDEGPKQDEGFFELVEKYRSECFRLLTNLKYYPRVDSKVLGDIVDVVNVLETVVWRFLSILKRYVEENNLEDRVVVDKLDSDMSNYIAHIRTLLDTTFSGPQERITYPRILFLSQSLVTAFNSLIGLCLLDAWKFSQKKMYKYEDIGFFNKELKKKEYITCDPELFYKGLYKSLKSHTGIFRRQLFVMTKGKVQQVFLPSIASGEKPILAEKIKGKTQKRPSAEEMFSDLDDSEKLVEEVEEDDEEIP